MQLGFGVRGQALGGLHRKAPATVFGGRVLVLGRGPQKDVVGFVQARLQVGWDLVGISRQTRTEEERVPRIAPLLIRNEIVLELAKPLAVPDGQVP